MTTKAIRRLLWISAVWVASISLMLGVLPDTAHSQEKAGKAHSAFRATSEAGCKADSWSPEVISFYGDPATVSTKLDSFEMKLPNRRIYMFLVETADSAELSLFEHADGKNFNVWHWKGRSASQLREEATNTILANRGVACVGEQVKTLVKALNPENKGAIPAPSSGRAAFGHVLRSYGDKYIRATIFLLC